MTERFSREFLLLAGFALLGICGILTILAVDAGSGGDSAVGFWVAASVFGWPGLALIALGAFRALSGHTR